MAKKPAKKSTRTRAKAKSSVKVASKTATRKLAKKPTKARVPVKAAEKTTSKRTPLDRSIIHLLHRAGQCAGDIFANEISGGDLTPRQYAVLVVISKIPGISQTGLVNETGVDRSTLADIMRRMQKKGLVKRTRTKSDARTYAVGLTAKGKKTLSKSAPAAKKADTRVLAALPVKDRTQLIAALERIVEKAEAKAA